MMEWPNKRTALFHDDPYTQSVTECVDKDCHDASEDALAHYPVEVIGEHAKDLFECPHMSHVVLWHELTPTDHALPVCPGGVRVTRKWLPVKYRKLVRTPPCDTVTVKRVG